MKQFCLALATLATGAVLAGCTMKSQEPPPLAGPSEYGTSIAISLAPDVLTQDGASQCLVSIVARDSNGQPLRNVSLRAEIQIGGVRADFGSLSARNLVTGNDGRASVVYTAPAAPSVSVDNGTVVDIAITPVGTDFNNTVPRSAAIRLVPPGIVVPPDGLRPAFTFTPPTPSENQTVLFDATGSTSGPGNPIASYSWNFGDGDRASGPTTGHGFSDAGSYVVTLTISDAIGRSAQKTANIIVGPGLNPTADFTLSPANPAINQPVNFNASASRPSPGTSIQSYDWTFGDGASGQGQITAHPYASAGSYRITLTVTDSSGHTATLTQTATVGSAPVALFSLSPTTPAVNQLVSFNASASTAPAGATIQSYTWSFGDGSSSQGQTTSHSFGAVGTYVVTLTVRDSAGQTGTTTQPVTVGAAASPNPVAAFTSSPTGPRSGVTTVNFNGAASQASAGRTIVLYQWLFGDGGSQQGVTATHLYNAVGTYVVTLTVTDDLGAKGSVTHDVTVIAVAPFSSGRE